MAPPTTDEGAPADRQPDIGLPRGEVAFRLLVEAVVDYAIFLLDPSGNVLTWNLGAERIKGYSADEIVGRHFSQFYTPEDRAAGRPARILGRAAADGRFEDEGWRVRKDGTRFWADVVITALRDRPGAPPYAFAKITRDLTERRAAEEQERRLMAEQGARAAAEEALAARDRFLSIASHELKTPVASLQVSAEAMIRAQEQGRLHDDRLSDGLRRIASATNRLGELVGELLDVSRLSSEHNPERRETTDLVRLTRDVVARLEDGDQAGRVRIVAPASLDAVVDPMRIDQVITNLVDNALKYSASSEPVDIELVADARGTEIRVSDRGIGLDASHRDRLFEAFGRGANAEHYQGIGLGLYISRQIVERHGGSIEARPRADGPGAVFTVHLPLPAGTS
ncbi:MAG: PAS domain-containing sensor histidine kinase [Chloroflexi bacterium]|nr:PAS domain-containing sensor histidine kinase [Chloroflexota bacterium]